MFTIQVISRNSGKPLKGQRVTCSFDGFLGTHTQKEYTDTRGEVHFNHEPKTGIVFVNGNNEFHGNLSGRVLIYI